MKALPKVKFTSFVFNESDEQNKFQVFVDDHEVNWKFNIFQHDIVRLSSEFFNRRGRLQIMSLKLIFDEHTIVDVDVSIPISTIFTNKYKNLPIDVELGLNCFKILSIFGFYPSVVTNKSNRNIFPMTIPFHNFLNDDKLQQHIYLLRMLLRSFVYVLR